MARLQQRQPSVRKFPPAKHRGGLVWELRPQRLLLEKWSNSICIKIQIPTPGTETGPLGVKFTQLNAFNGKWKVDFHPCSVLEVDKDGYGAEIGLMPGDTFYEDFDNGVFMSVESVRLLFGPKRPKKPFQIQVGRMKQLPSPPVPLKLPSPKSSYGIPRKGLWVTRLSSNGMAQLTLESTHNELKKSKCDFAKRWQDDPFRAILKQIEGVYICKVEFGKSYPHFILDMDKRLIVGNNGIWDIHGWLPCRGDGSECAKQDKEKVWKHLLDCEVHEGKFVGSEMEEAKIIGIFKLNEQLEERIRELTGGDPSTFSV